MYYRDTENVRVGIQIVNVRRKNVLRKFVRGLSFRLLRPETDKAPLQRSLVLHAGGTPPDERKHQNPTRRPSRTLWLATFMLVP